MSRAFQFICDRLDGVDPCDDALTDATLRAAARDLLLRGDIPLDGDWRRFIDAALNPPTPQQRRVLRGEREREAKDQVRRLRIKQIKDRDGISEDEATKKAALEEGVTIKAFRTAMQSARISGASRRKNI